MSPASLRIFRLQAINPWWQVPIAFQIFPLDKSKENDASISTASLKRAEVRKFSTSGNFSLNDAYKKQVLYSICFLCAKIYCLWHDYLRRGLLDFAVAIFALYFLIEKFIARAQAPNITIIAIK